MWVPEPGRNAPPRDHIREEHSGVSWALTKQHVLFQRHYSFQVLESAPSNCFPKGHSFIHYNAKMPTCLSVFDDICCQSVAQIARCLRKDQTAKQVLHAPFIHEKLTFCTALLPALHQTGPRSAPTRLSQSCCLAFLQPTASSARRRLVDLLIDKDLQG